MGTIFRALVGFCYQKSRVFPSGFGFSGTRLHHYFKGLLEIVKLLVECGADIDARNNNKETPVCISNRENHKEISKYILEHKSEADDG